MNRLYDSCLTMALGSFITLILGLVFSLLFDWPVQLLWNWLLPELFNLPHKSPSFKPGDWNSFVVCCLEGE